MHALLQPQKWNLKLCSLLPSIPLALCTNLNNYHGTENVKKLDGKIRWDARVSSRGNSGLEKKVFKLATVGVFQLLCYSITRCPARVSHNDDDGAVGVVAGFELLIYETRAHVSWKVRSKYPRSAKPWTHAQVEGACVFLNRRILMWFLYLFVVVWLLN